MKTIKEQNVILDYFEGVVWQKNKATNSIMEYGYYLRSRSFSPKEGLPLHCDLYLLIDDKIECIAYNATAHRCKQLIKAYKNGTLKNVPAYVLQNYVTNGYNTRRGLFADYASKKERIERIADSHAAIIGGYNSKEEHLARVRMRNRNY